jgi:hypothetical protein
MAPLALVVDRGIVVGVLDEFSINSLGRGLCVAPLERLVLAAGDDDLEVDVGPAIGRSRLAFTETSDADSLARLKL